MRPKKSSSMRSFEILLPTRGIADSQSSFGVHIARSAAESLVWSLNLEREAKSYFEALYVFSALFAETSSSLSS